QYKSVFRQIHLSRNLLHGRIVNPAPIGKDRQWIAAEDLIGEDIALDERVVRHRKLSVVNYRWPWIADRSFASLRAVNFEVSSKWGLFMSPPRSTRSRRMSRKVPERRQ